jgi:hypothetical protein
MLRRFIRHGALRVRDAGGTVHVFGDRLPGPDIAIHLRDPKLDTRLFLNPELYGARDIGQDDLHFQGHQGIAALGAFTSPPPRDIAAAAARWAPKPQESRLACPFAADRCACD